LWESLASDSRSQSAELAVQKKKKQKVEQLVARFENVTKELRDLQASHPHQCLKAPSQGVVRAYNTLSQPSDDDVV
jgi:hypothetical protein